MAGAESKPGSLLYAVTHGKPLNRAPGRQPSLGLTDQLTEANAIDASTIRDILTGVTPPDPNHPLDPNGVVIQGALIQGALDLDGVDAKHGVRLVACRLDSMLSLRNASLPWLDLHMCRLTGVAADRAQPGRLTLADCALELDCADGALRLIDAHITQDLRLSATEIKNRSGPAILASGLTVDHDALLGGLTATGSGSLGALNLVGAVITGRLSLRGATLTNTTGPALAGDLITVSGGVRMDRGFDACGTGDEGAVCISEATITGSLELDGATVTNTNGPAIVADLATLKGDVSMSSWHGDPARVWRFRATGAGERGAIRLRVATISGDLNLDEAEVTERGLPNAVDGSPFAPAGAVCLIGATISGELRSRRAALTGRTGPAFRGDYMIVKGDAFRCERREDGLRAMGTGRLGVLCLPGAGVTGQLCLRGAVLTNASAEHPSLLADLISVKGRALLDQGFRATGAVRLWGASLTGQLSLQGAEVTSAAQADDRNGGYAAAVWLSNATVGGQLVLRGADLESCNGPAMMADYLTVTGDAFLGIDGTRRFRATGNGKLGAVCLTGASISGRFSMNGSDVTNTAITPPDLVANQVKIQGDADIADCFSTRPQKRRAALLLHNASLSKDLVCAIEMRDTERTETRAPAADKPRHQLVLTAASVGTLRLTVDGLSLSSRATSLTVALSQASRRNETRRSDYNLLKLDDFTYTGMPRLSGGPLGLDSDRPAPVGAWIEVLCVTDYAPQPYQALAAAYDAVGDDRSARKLLMAQRDDARVRGQLTPWALSYQWLLKALIGYGYKAIRALYWLLGLFVVTALMAVLWFKPSDYIGIPANTLTTAPISTSTTATKGTTSTTATKGTTTTTATKGTTSTTATKGTTTTTATNGTTTGTGSSGSTTPANTDAPVPLDSCHLAGALNYAFATALPLLSLAATDPQCGVPTQDPAAVVVIWDWVARALAALLYLFYGAGITGLTAKPAAT